MGVLDFLLEEEGVSEVYDLVLFVYNPNLSLWLEKLRFMHIRYKVITDKWEKNKDLNSDSVVYLKGSNVGNLWTYIFNHYKSFNYGMVGDMDTPENFDIMYLTYMESGAHLCINDNPSLYDSFNASFNMVNPYMDSSGSSYCLFKWSYLKFCLEHDNGMNFRHRLVYYKNAYPDLVKGSVVEFLGVNTPVSRGAKNKLARIKAARYRPAMPYALSAIAIAIGCASGYPDLLKNIILVVCGFLPAFAAMNIFMKEVY